jgi:hypothetical protein
MTPMREFKETVRALLKSDRKYRKKLLREGVECLLVGDLQLPQPKLHT